MLRKLTTVAAMLLPTLVTAQEIQTFLTSQDCSDSLTMLSPSFNLGESPLFTGENVIFGVNGTPYVGTMMFTVNQNTGTWTMFTLYEDNTVCTVAFGQYFEPVTN